MVIPPTPRRNATIGAKATRISKSFTATCTSKCGTLQIYQKLYEKANGDLDTFFSEANKLPGVKSEIIEKGSVYHLCFMECTCMLHQQGYVSTPLLCECSK